MLIAWDNLYKMTYDAIHFLKEEGRIFSIENKGKSRFTECPCFQTLKPKM